MANITSFHYSLRSALKVTVNFTPHLMPMARGILETIYVKLKPGTTAADLKEQLQKTYESESFVTVLDG